MCQQGSFKGLSVYMTNGLALEIVQAVQVFLVMADFKIPLSIFNDYTGLKYVPLAVLYKLTHGVKVSSEVHTCREYSLSILAFGFTVKLLPPFSKVLESGFVIYKDFNILSPFVEDLPGYSILVASILIQVWVPVLDGSLMSPLHKLVYVYSSHRQWKQTNWSKNRVPAPYIIRNHKNLIAFICGQGLQGSLAAISCGKNPVSCLFLSILVLQMGLKYPECYCRLSGCAGLGNYIYIDLLVLQGLHQVCHVLRRHIVPCKVNLRSLSLLPW